MCRGRARQAAPAGGAASGRRLARIVARFARMRVLVVGDLMLDQFIWGAVQRISPEAPVPVVRVSGQEYRAGGAGNVVANVRALGGRAITCGIVGRDRSGEQILHELRSLGADVSGVVRSPSAVTIRKTRIIAHNQQVVRLDREGRDHDRRTADRVRRFLLRRYRDVDAVVVSDYGKGVIRPELLAALGERWRAERFLCLVDPKRANFSHYGGATLYKPNLDEASWAAGVEIVDEETLRQAGRKLQAMWRAEAVLISRGEHGMSLFKQGGTTHEFPTAAREVFDVTGAGDTLLATCALALAAGATMEEAAVLANHAAGVVVGKLGTATVSRRELLAALADRGAGSGGRPGA